MAEGVEETQDDITKIFTDLGIVSNAAAKYAAVFDEISVSSIDDVKYLADSGSVEELMVVFAKQCKDNQIKLPLIHRKKIKDACEALSSCKTKKSHAISIAPDAEERKSLELLAKYMKFIQTEMIKVDDCVNGSQLEAYCDQIRDESSLLQQSIEKREKELIKEATEKFDEVKTEYTAKQENLKKLALSMTEIKKKCDNALNMNEYDQLEERRNIICKSVDSVKKQMGIAMSESVDGSMKTIKMNLSDFKTMNDKISKLGKIYFQQPFEIVVKNVSINGNKFEIFWDIENGEYFHNHCNEMTLSVVKYADDQKEKEMEETLCSKRVFSIATCAELQFDKKMIRNNDTLIFRLSALNKMVERRYKYVSDGIKFAGYVEWTQDVTMSCEEEDNAMNKACKDKFFCSRAATDLEIIKGRVKGLVKSPRNRYISAHSGGGDLWKGDAYTLQNGGNREFFRHCWVYNGWPYTANNYAGNWESGNPLCIAVSDIAKLRQV